MQVEGTVSHGYVAYRPAGCWGISHQAAGQELLVAERPLVFKGSGRGVRTGVSAARSQGRPGFGVT